MKDGSERLVHHIQLLLESNPGWVILKSDVKNAFNSISRSHMLKEVRKSFPDIYHHVYQIYSGFSPLIFCQENSTILHTAEEGVQQGDPLGPALFSVSIQSLLQSLQENSKHPHIHVLAYLDDVFLIRPLGQTIPALEDMKASFSNVGLTIANEKCEIYISKDVDSCSTPVTIPISTSGTSILGVPIGDPENISSFCLEFAKSGKCLCDQLLNLDDPQAGMLLLRYCHVS